MRIIATFPKLRGMFIQMIKSYVLFLWACSITSLIATGINTAEGRVVPAFIYLISWFFFTTSALMYSELGKELAKMRFTNYWRFFSHYSPPLGGYAVLHILTGLVFVTMDVLMGNYGLLAVMIIIKGVFEHSLNDFMDDLKTASILYEETMSGELDRLALKDPFK